MSSIVRPSRTATTRTSAATPGASSPPDRAAQPPADQHSLAAWPSTRLPVSAPSGSLGVRSPHPSACPPTWGTGVRHRPMPAQGRAAASPDAPGVLAGSRPPNQAAPVSGATFSSSCRPVPHRPPDLDMRREWRVGFRVAVQVDMRPTQRPRFLRPCTRHHRHHDVAVQRVVLRQRQHVARLGQRQGLGRPALPTLGHVAQLHYVPVDQAALHRTLHRAVQARVDLAQRTRGERVGQPLQPQVHFGSLQLTYLALPQLREAGSPGTGHDSSSWSTHRPCSDRASTSPQPPAGRGSAPRRQPARPCRR